MKMLRYRIISKSYGIEQYDVTIKQWNDMVKRFENSNRTITDLYFQEQYIPDIDNIDHKQLAQWETISEYKSQN